MSRSGDQVRGLSRFYEGHWRSKPYVHESVLAPQGTPPHMPILLCKEAETLRQESASAGGLARIKPGHCDPASGYNSQMQVIPMSR